MKTWLKNVGPGVMVSAGITSSITAPLAAAYVVKGFICWKKGLKSLRFKVVWSTVLLLGIFFSSLQLNPISIIKFAQVANGLLLSVIAIFLFWIVNKTSVLGEFRNTLKQNVLGIIIIGITIFLGAKSIYTVIQGI